MAKVVYTKTELLLYEIEKLNFCDIMYITPIDINKNCDDECNKNIDILENYINNCVKNNRCFYLIYDISNESSMIPTKYILNCVNMFKRNKENLQKNLIKTFAVGLGTFIQTISKVLFLIYTPVRPYEFVSTLEEAKEKLFKLNN